MKSHTTLTAYLKLLFVKYKIYFISLFIIAVLASICSIQVRYKIKELIDSISSNPHGNIEVLLIAFVFYKLTHHGMFFISRLLDIKYKPEFVVKTITDMYIKTLGHSLHWFDSNLSGEISNKITDFQNNVIILITNSFYTLNRITTIIISIIFLFNVNIISAFVTLLFIIIYIPILTLLLRKQMKLQEQYTSARQRTVGIINDSISNIFSIKIIGNSDTEFKLKLTPSLLNWANWDKKTRKFDAYFVDNADTIIVTTMIGIQIYLLTFLYKTGQISAGDFAFISMVTLNIHEVLDSLLEGLLFIINPAIASMKASLAFINTTYDTPDKIGAKNLANITGDVKFKNVSFAYSGSDNNVLHNFNLHIKAGQRIGIVGTSGAGKTTLIKCLLRYFDIKQGAILIDNKNIVDVAQESLRANISVIPQDITMFHRSILENLQFAKYDASLDEIYDSCKKAKIHDDIMNMQNGYDGVVGERGVKLSGGQRQRIAIARAILKNAPILILDEATSALDTPTEKLIQESIDGILATSNATTIVIAHRLSTLLHMDRILVLKEGNIIEDGTHSELLILNGIYKSLWDAQIGGFLAVKENLRK